LNPPGRSKADRPWRTRTEPSKGSRFSALGRFSPVRLAAAGLVSVVLLGCLFDVAGKGGGTETESKVAGRAVDPEGNPSVGARVILRPSDYLADLASMEGESKRRRETITDAQGRYAFKGIPMGDYRLEIAGTESGGSVRDFPLVGNTQSLALELATLKPRGSIVGSFAPDSEAQLASFVQVFGMERLVKAEPSGAFVLYNLPEGVYDIRCSSLQPFRREAVIRRVKVRSGEQTRMDPVTLAKEAKLAFSEDSIGLRIEGLDSTNPVIFDNELWDKGVENEYIWAKASAGSLDLRGNIATKEFQGAQSDIDDQLAAGNRQLRSAKLAGFTGIPAVVRGAVAKLSLPASGRIEDIAASPSAGSDLIVAEARKATPEKPLLVVVGGPLTTVAQAYLTDPSIAPRMVVAGVFSFNLQSSDSVANYLVAKKCRFVQWGRTYIWVGQRDSARLQEIPPSRMGERTRAYLATTPKLSLGDIAPVAYLFDRRLWKTAQMVQVSSTLEVQTASDITFDFLDIPLAANEWTRYENAFYAALAEPRAYHPLLLPGRLEGEGFMGVSAGVSVVTADSATGDEAVSLGAGAWAEFRIAVATGKTHAFTLRYHSVGGAKISLTHMGQAVPMELDLPASADWKEAVFEGLDLASGTYALRVSGISGTCVLDWIDIAPAP
jgi:hypothetical protein